MSKLELYCKICADKNPYSPESDIAEHCGWDDGFIDGIQFTFEYIKKAYPFFGEWIERETYKKIRKDYE